MKNRKGFTLIELLVVMGIIVVLVTILVPVILGAWRRASETAQKADFQAISTALEQYKQDLGDYPRNTLLPRWNYDVVFRRGPPMSAPDIYLSICTAWRGTGLDSND